MKSLSWGMGSLAGLLFFLPFAHVTFLRDVLFGLACLVFAIRHAGKKRRRHPALLPSNTLFHLLLLASLLWNLVALAGAVDPLYSFRAILHKMVKAYLLYFLAFYFMREAIVEKQPCVRWFLLPLATAALVMSVSACYQFAQHPVFVENRASGFTGGFYRLSVFLVLSIPLVAVLGMVSQGLWRGFHTLVLLLSLVALFVTFTRAAWIAVAVEAVLFLFFSVPKHRRLLLSAVVTMICILALLLSSPLVPRKLLIHGPSSEGARLRAIGLSLDIIKAHPLFGIGYGKGTFQKYYPGEELGHSHNLLLNTAIETGLPGLLILVSLLVVVLRTLSLGLASATDPRNRSVLMGILAAAVGFLCLNMFDYMYLGWSGQMFWLLVGLGQALILGESRDRAGEKAPVMSGTGAV